VDANDRVAEKAFRRVIRHCLEAGVDGIFAGGSAGMGPLLTEKQWRRAMEIARDEVGGRHVLMGGVIAPSTAIALERIRILDRIGYRMMVVTPTYYIALSRDAELLAHFGACRAATGMEMAIYNIPQCTGSPISLAAMRTMGRRGWSKLVKESSGDRKYFAQVLELGREYGLAVLQGNELDIEWSLRRGAAGIVPVCANYEPATYVTACRAARAGNAALLAAAQRRANALRDALVLGDKNWISGIMYGLHTLGIGSGRPVRPLQELTAAAKRPIARLKTVALE
jgi:4-hydroxy-tetrahydrodipicolinate synthase